MDQPDPTPPSSGQDRFRVRPLETVRGGRLARLCTELGYPVSEDELAARLRTIGERLAGGAPEAIFVAEDADGEIAGFLHVRAERALTHPPLGEVLALVVAEEQRGRGAGAALLARAERWCRAAGLTRIRIRSRVERERAHAFYLRAGYRVAKTQRVFEKEIGEGGGEET